MGLVICITGTFDVMRNGRPTGQKEFVVSHGIDEVTGRTVILPNDHPARLGARLDRDLMEWVLDDNTNP
ncbi:MAG: hypothetical protein HC793_00510 [Aquincola sp.]|nr:hypothetical protein [Aquincola sp.]